jgi:hypothetical protein
MLIEKTWDHGKEQKQIQPKISMIFKEKIADIPQAFGSFVDDNGEKYCAVAALIKYLGHDMSKTRTTIVAADKVQNDNKNNNNINSIELIPPDVLEMIENFCPYDDIRKYRPKCFCSKPDYYYCYSLTSLLIHLNDHHKMTFIEIGGWLESKGL